MVRTQGAAALPLNRDIDEPGDVDRRQRLAA
jgi:hypothetical protein